MFDGALVAGAGAWCSNLARSGWKQCPGLLADGTPSRGVQADRCLPAGMDMDVLDRDLLLVRLPRGD